MVAMLVQTGSSVAADYAALQDVPARLVDAALVFAAGRNEAAEWARLKAESKQKVNKR